MISVVWVLKRRLVSVGGLFLATALVLALSPLLLVGAIVADVVLAPRRFPSTRALAFGVGYLLYETAGVLMAGAIWVTELGGRRGRGRWIDANSRLQAWWTKSLIDLARRVLRLQIDVDGSEHATPGPVFVFGRHVSLVDSLVAAHHLGVTHGFEMRFVLKQELTLDPCLDIVGHRLVNHFVDRDAGTAAEIAAVGRLAEDLHDRVGVVIFPEGTRYNTAKAARAIERMQERGADAEEIKRAASLDHLLPPRPGGALALLDRDAEADVVIFGHVGFEGLDSFAGLWRQVPFRHPVQVSLTRVPRAEIPTGQDERAAWLLDQWIELDGWIDRTLDERRTD